MTRRSVRPLQTGLSGFEVVALGRAERVGGIELTIWVFALGLWTLSGASRLFELLRQRAGSPVLLPSSEATHGAAGTRYVS